MSGKGTHGLVIEEPLLIELSRAGAQSFSLPKLDVPEAKDIPDNLKRATDNGLPEVSEPEVVRHYFRMSQWNYNVESGVYPLGSCTMKHNPKINEKLSRMKELTNTHPYDPEELVQGNLKLMKDLEDALCSISGMDAVSLAPAAGAHGELTGIMIIRAYHIANSNKRHKIIIPDTAHGTNPATSALAGFEVIEVKTGSDGYLTPQIVAEVMDEDTAGIMITNPNTLGIFEKEIKAIAKIVHDKGGLVYMDGANLNALMGYVRPGDIGIDVMHFNLHKTFSTPHGGGGPGAGPVGVKSHLESFLPIPRIVRHSDHEYSLSYSEPNSIGRMRSFVGNFGVFIRALAYILENGADGLKQTTQSAVLNANYVWEKLKPYYHLPYSQRPLHESVFSDKLQHDFGISNVDIVKRLIDKGYHPPTMSFPLIVHGALMIEPTESESKDELDEFCDAMIEIAQEAETSSEILKEAPKIPFRNRLNEVLAARKPKLTWESYNK